MSGRFLQEAIGKIYDCAIEPELWRETLEHLRVELDTAFCSLQFVHFPETYPDDPPFTELFHTDWDTQWFAALQPHIATIPNFERMLGSEIDTPMTQMQVIDEPTFKESAFYVEWVAPQRLRDTLNANVIRRDNMTAILSSPSYETRELFSDADRALVGKLTPHVRRALLISDLLNEKKSQVEIYQRMLDGISCAVYLVEKSGKLMYCNAAGDALLSDARNITAIQGHLQIPSQNHRAPFMTAVDRACTGQDTDLESWGNGIPLPAKDASPAVAYVLPLGKSDLRRALGPGLAAVFVTTHSQARPPALEIVCAVTGLTTAEARVALAISNGQTPQETADGLGVSVHTVRKQLSVTFDKTGLRNQAELSAFLARMTPPTHGKTSTAYLK